MFFTCYFTIGAAAALLGSSPSPAASNDLPLALLRLLAPRPSSLARADANANAAPHRPSFVALLQAACCLDTHKIAAAATFLRLNCNCCLHLVVGPRPS